MSEPQQKLEVFYDFLCPYCCQGVTELMDMLENHPALSIQWVPCEAHPRPEFAPQHSDLAAAALLAVVAEGGNPVTFNRLVYRAVYTERIRIDNPRVLTELAARAGADAQKVRAALDTGRYAKEVAANNELVWDKLGFEAVPSYRMNGQTLGSGSGVVVEKPALCAFLDKQLA